MLVDDMPRATQAAIGAPREPVERTRPPAGTDDPRKRLLAAVPLAERRLEVAGVRTAEAFVEALGAATRTLARS